MRAAGKLLHSKLTMGHGKLQTDEELDSLLEKIERLLQTRKAPAGDTACE